MRADGAAGRRRGFGGVAGGAIDPGRVFDRSVGLDGVPCAYRAMTDRRALKVPIRP